MHHLFLFPIAASLLSACVPTTAVVPKTTIESDLALFSGLGRLRIMASMEGFCDGLSEEETAGQRFKDLRRIAAIRASLEREHGADALSGESNIPIESGCGETVSHDRRARFEAVLHALERRLRIEPPGPNGS